MKTLFFALICLVLYAPSFAQNLDSQGLDEILAGIQALEGDRDPKCYATASRLEDFMYGTPLSDSARHQKNSLQKQLAELVWRRADVSSQTISAQEIKISFEKIIALSSNSEGVYVLTFPNAIEMTIQPTDIRQYGSVAYSLRAILAVQQDALMTPDKEPLKPLTSEAIEALKQMMDMATLALLQEADAYARAHNEYEISLENINRAWLALFQMKQEPIEKPGSPVVYRSAKPELLSRIINQKIASYAEYNQVSNQLFVRNMQVYFARLSWPTDKAEAEAFRAGFIDALVGYGIELYKGVVEVAARNGSQVIQEDHVARFVQHFTPYEINEYEDIRYFPGQANGWVDLEAYDLDAFRDSGVHWVYLGYALESPEITQYLDVDPFAAELMAENVAQFGVLILREAGLEGAKIGEERLSLELLASAMQRIQEKVNSSLAGESSVDTTAAEIHSTDEADRPSNDQSSWFTDITQGVGIDSMHRSSDWLNRLLRSYLRRDKGTGIITIPPRIWWVGCCCQRYK